MKYVLPAIISQHGWGGGWVDMGVARVLWAYQAHGRNAKLFNFLELGRGGKREWRAGGSGTTSSVTTILFNPKHSPHHHHQPASLSVRTTLPYLLNL